MTPWDDAMSPEGDALALPQAPEAHLRQLLRRIRETLREHYGLTNVRIRPLGGGASRFSLPCQLIGTHGGRRIPLFAKIVGTSDLLTVVASQFIKNMYLTMNAKDSLFDVPTSALEVAEYQSDTLARMRKLGLNTARPLGFHPLDGVRVLLVTEWIEGTPLSRTTVTPQMMESAFGQLAALHRGGVQHGDLKSDNIMVGPTGKVFLLDVARFRESAPVRAREAYDLACLMCTMAQYQSSDAVIAAASKNFDPGRLQTSAEYLGLVRRRPDFYLTDLIAERLRNGLRRR